MILYTLALYSLEFQFIVTFQFHFYYYYLFYIYHFYTSWLLYNLVLITFYKGDTLYFLIYFRTPESIKFNTVGLFVLGVFRCLRCLVVPIPGSNMSFPPSYNHIPQARLTIPLIHLIIPPNKSICFPPSVPS